MGNVCSHMVIHPHIEKLRAPPLVRSVQRFCQHLYVVKIIVPNYSTHAIAFNHNKYDGSSSLHGRTSQLFSVAPREERKSQESPSPRTNDDKRIVANGKSRARDERAASASLAVYNPRADQKPRRGCISARLILYPPGLSLPSQRAPLMQTISPCPARVPGLLAKLRYGIPEIPRDDRGAAVASSRCRALEMFRACVPRRERLYELYDLLRPSTLALNNGPMRVLPGAPEKSPALSAVASGDSRGGFWRLWAASCVDSVREKGDSSDG